MSSHAAAELLRRRGVRKSLAEWARHCGFEPAPHHQLLIKHLERIARGQIGRFAIFLPPGSAKSTYGSVLFPPWFMANNAGKSIIAASHTTELAEKWGRRVRNLVSENGTTLGISLSPESQAAGRWALTSGGEYFASGVGSAIVGFRADIGIIDDPVRGHEEAYSETTREKVWEWYRADLLTRLRPGGSVVLITTRWHEDDLAGRALQEGGWEVVSLPAEAESDDLLGRQVGEFLWDEGEYGYGNWLREQKAKQPAYNWSALFQQRPAPEEGEYFQAAWLKPYAPNELPDLKTLSIFGASDYAVSEGKGDHTVHVVVGLDPEDRMFLLDLWRGQKAPDVWVDAFCDLVLKWKPQGWAEEQGQIKSALGPFLEKRMSERRAYVARAKFPTKGDKTIRGQSIRGRMAVKGLYVPTHADWYPDFRAELLGFPVAKFDDQVDALSLIGQLTDKMWPGHPLPTKTPPKILSTDSSLCTVTLSDLFTANERRHKKSTRIR